MPIRGTGESLEGGRWVASARWIEGIDADRARQRTTLTYRLTETFRLGVEWNPIGDDVGLLANWLAFEERGNLPAVLFGTSSDRIGTEDGRVYYVTASKNLERWLGISAAPYLGTSWSDETYEWQELAGLQYRLFDDRLSVTHLWDGVNLHHTADLGHVGTYLGVRALEHTTLGLIVAEQDGSYFFGVTIGTVF